MAEIRDGPGFAKVAGDWTLRQTDQSPDSLTATIRKLPGQDSNLE